MPVVLDLCCCSKGIICSAAMTFFSCGWCGGGGGWWEDTGEEEGPLMEDWRTGSGGPDEGVACLWLDSA